MLRYVKRSSIWRWLIVGCVLLALGMPVLAQGGTVVKVEADQVTVEVGGTVTVLVNIENVSDLYGVEMLITYDVDRLEIIDADATKPGIQVAPGDFLSPDFPGANLVEEGIIDYAVTQVAPRVPASGDGILLRIVFRAKAAGEASVTLDSILLSNPVGAGIANTRLSGSVRVGSDAPAPPETPLPEQTPTPIATPPPDSPATPVPTATPPPTPIAVPPTPTVGHTPTAGPTPTADILPVALDCSRVQGYHIVKRGETLYAIARAYGVQPRAIATCNRLLDPRKIHASNRLAIPHAPWMPVPSGPTAERQFGVGTAAAGCRLSHAIRCGETMTFIAGRYGVSVWTLARANRIANSNLIYAGRTLCVP